MTATQSITQTRIWAGNLVCRKTTSNSGSCNDIHRNQHDKDDEATVTRRAHDIAKYLIVGGRDKQEGNKGPLAGSSIQAGKGPGSGQRAKGRANPPR